MTTQTKEFKVTGMSCGHCENAVRSELQELTGISEIQVDAKTGELKVTIDDGATVSNEDILAAVDEAGYEASPVI